MLFYERRKKKPLKIVVPREQVPDSQESLKAQGLKKDEQLNQWHYVKPFQEAANGELANKIYKDVQSQNLLLTFENDVFSKEFLDFVVKLLKYVS